MRSAERAFAPTRGGSQAPQAEPCDTAVERRRPRAGCPGARVRGSGDDGRSRRDHLRTGRGGRCVAGVRAILTYETPEKTTITVDGLDEGEPGQAAARIPSFSAANVRRAQGHRLRTREVGAEQHRRRGSTSHYSTSQRRLQHPGRLDRPDDIVACGDIPQEVAES